jgi:hypothetical protein
VVEVECSDTPIGGSWILRSSAGCCRADCWRNRPGELGCGNGMGLVGGRSGVIKTGSFATRRMTGGVRAKSLTPPDRVPEMLGAGGINSGVSYSGGLRRVRWRRGGRSLGLGLRRGGLRLGLRLGWFALFRFGCGREEVAVVAVDGVAPAVGAERLPGPLFERRTLSSEGREKRIHINAEEYGS